MWSHPLVLTLAGSVLAGLGWLLGRTFSQNSEIAKMSTVLTGIDGKNGMRGELAKLAARDEEVLGILRRNTDLTHEFVGRVTLTEDRIAALRLDHNELRADFRAHITGHGAPPAAPLLDRRAS